MHYPVDKKIKISQGFGDTNFAKEHRYFYKVFGGIHPGLDFATPPNSQVFSVLPGIVTRREWHVGMGFTMGIRTGNIFTIYAHLNKFIADLGHAVREGEKIAISGDTGRACTEPHLHMEMRDLTLNTLAERVFEPDFSRDYPKQYQETYEYIVNDEKTIQELVVKHYGKIEKQELFLERNQHLSNYTPNESIKTGTVVKIS